MLENIRNSLRRTNKALDSDIKSNIEAALLDMSRVGISTDKIIHSVPATYDRLHEKCCELYCKWMFDYCGKGESWREAYEKLRDSMASCGKYTVRNE